MKSKYEHVKGYIDGREVSELEMLRWEVREYKKSMTLLREKLGTEGMRRLLKDVVAQSMTEQHSKGTADGRVVECSIDVEVKGCKAMEFLAWLGAAFKREDHIALNVTAPEHYLNDVDENGQVVGIETVGAYGLPQEFHTVATKPEELGLPAENINVDYPVKYCGLMYGPDGTEIHKFRHLMRDTDDGFVMKPTVYFSVDDPQEMIEGHKWHLACEFTNVMNIFLREKNGHPTEGYFEKVTTSIDGRPVDELELLRWELSRYQVSMPLLRRLIGVDGMRDLLADVTEQSLKDFRSYAPLDGQWQRCTIDLYVEGATYEKMLAWLGQAIMRNDTSVNTTNPGHFLSTPLADRRVETIETVGGYGLPLRFFLSEAKADELVLSPEDKLEDALGSGGLMRGTDGEEMIRAAHYFKNTAEGYHARGNIYFPASAPREMVEGHQRHLICEFTNAVNLYWQSQEA